MTQNQVSDEDVLAWIRERLMDECEQYERASSAPAELAGYDLDLTDVLYVLQTATKIGGRYDGECFIVRGKTLDGVMLSVVVAPPSAKNRVRVVKVWIG